MGRFLNSLPELHKTSTHTDSRTHLLSFSEALWFVVFSLMGVKTSQLNRTPEI